jgi:hypothetical protein
MNKYLLVILIAGLISLSSCVENKGVTALTDETAVPFVNECAANWVYNYSVVNKIVKIINTLNMDIEDFIVWKVGS